MNKLEAARKRCDETVTDPLPCHNVVYLEARKEYHKLLVEAGLTEIQFTDLVDESQTVA